MENFLCEKFLTYRIDELIAQLQAWKEEGAEVVHCINERGEYDYVELTVTVDPKITNFALMRDACTDKPFVLIKPA